LTIDEPNYSTDDPVSSASTAKIGTSTQKARAAQRNKHWSAMDLARELTDEDPVGAITGRIGQYWASDDQTRMLRSLQGIIADNIANDASDMVNDISTDGAIADSNRISVEALADTIQTLGDHGRMITTVAMHSVQHARLVRSKLVNSNFDPKTGELLWQDVAGLRIIVDDAMPVNADGANPDEYTVALFGPNSIIYAPGPVQTPSEISREALTGDGGGQTIISSRVNNVFHPNGFSFLSADITDNGQSASYAELQNAANWDRVVPRKLVPMAFLVCVDAAD